MGLFSKLFQSGQAARPALGAQPHKDWGWTSLSINGMPTGNFTWEDVARALDALGPHNDSFVILEQKQGGDYWFIQSTVALQGPHTGEYVVGVGWSGPEGKGYIERCGTAKYAMDMFHAAWQGKPLDFSGFEDQSDMLS